MVALLGKARVGLTKLGWLRERIGRLTFREIVFRIRTQVQKRFEWILLQMRRPAPEEKDSGVLLPGYTAMELFRGQSENLSCFEGDRRAPGLTLELPPDGLDPQTKLENYRAGIVPLFGELQRLGRPFAWRRDWETGTCWPLVHWSRIKYRFPEDGRDIRRSWELNRLQHLTAAAGEAVLAGDEEARNLVVDDLESWLEANPPLRGPSWASSLELGLRLISFGWLRLLVGDLVAVRQDLSRRLLGSIWLHARQIRRYPSLYSSANNHLVGEALGLYAVGVFFPEFRDAEDWRDDGRRIMEREASRQILPSGASFEQTTAYSRFLLELYVVYIWLAECSGEEVCAELLDRVERGLELLMELLPRGGEIPLIGDNDDGIVLCFGDTRISPTRALLNLGALQFDRPEFTLGSGDEPDERVFWLYGASGLERWRQLKREAANLESRPGNGVRVCEGFAILRASCRESDVQLTLRGGAFGAPPTWGHAHADLLSVTLAVDGRMLVVDPGSFLYFGAPYRREYLRSTCAHSLLQVDGLEQARQSGSFLWDGPPKSWCRRIQTKRGPELRAGLRLDPGEAVFRQERAIRVTSGCVEIRDGVRYPGHHRAVLRWHLHAAWDVSDQERGAVSVRHPHSAVKLEISLRDSEGKRVTEWRREQAWWSPRYGNREPCDKLKSILHFQDQGDWLTRFTVLSD